MSIKIRLMAAFLASILISISIIMVIVIWQTREDARLSFSSAATGQLMRVNNLLAQMFQRNEEIASYLAMLPEIAVADGKLPIYTQTTEALNYQRQDLTPEGQALDVRLELLQKAHPGFAAVSVGMRDGAYWQYPPVPRRAGYDPRERSWYKQGLAADGPVLTPAFLNSSDELIYSVVNKVTHEGKLLGVATLDITLTSLVKLVSAIRIGESGYVMLLEDNGVILADPRHEQLAFKNISEGDIPALKDIVQVKDSTFTAEIDGEDRFVTVLNGAKGWKMLAVIDTAEVYAGTNRLLLKIGLFSLLAVALVLLCAAKFVAVISTPIRELEDIAGRIAEGDVAVLNKQETFKGDMLALHSAFRAMALKLFQRIDAAEEARRQAEERAALAHEACKQAQDARALAEQRQAHTLAAAGQLEPVAAVVSSSSGQLVSQIETAAHDTVDLAARMQHMLTLLERVSAAMQDVSRSAMAASEVSASTRQKAAAGSTVVEKALNAIRHVQEESLKLKNDMEKLGEHAQSINRIMGVISDIADQTNLLALNAAIEAARAGDAGRGFAVVADEVRKLAEKTMASTTDVAEAIKAIQCSVGNSKEQVDLAVSSIEQATSFAEESGAALQEIVTMAEGTAAQVRSIVEAGEEQAAAGEEFTQSIGLLNEVSTQTAGSMQSAGESVQGLKTQTENLATLIVKMRN